MDAQIARDQAALLFRRLRAVGVEISESAEQLLSPGVAATFADYHRIGMRDMRRVIVRQFGTILDRLADQMTALPTTPDGG